MTQTPKMVDNEYYQDYIIKLVKEGQNGLSVLYDLLEFVHEIGQVDIHQNFKQFSEHEWIKFSGIDEAYSNVQDLIEFIKLVIADKK